jgi:hypothetical protein
VADEPAIRQLAEKMAEERGKLLGQIRALSEEEAERRPVDAEGEAQWSVKEQCAHLAEMETAYRAWVERALVEENPNLTGVRGEPVAVSLEEANGRLLSVLVDELRSQRARTLALMERLRPEDYDRKATQPIFGTLTVLQWLRSYYRHDRMHQDQIAGREQTYKPRFAGGQEPDQRRTRAQ